MLRGRTDFPIIDECPQFGGKDSTVNRQQRTLAANLGLATILTLGLANETHGQQDTFAMSGTNLVVMGDFGFERYAAKFREFAQRGVRAVRLQMIDLSVQDNNLRNAYYFSQWDPTIPGNEKAYFDAFFHHTGPTWVGLGDQINVIKSDILPALRSLGRERRGMKLILDLHTAPGVYSAKNGAGDPRMLDDPLKKSAYANMFVKCWKEISFAFKSEREIMAFDLQNEPPTIDGHYTARIQKTIDTIRQQGANQTIVIEAKGDARTIRQLRPFRDRLHDLVYSVHLYRPAEDFTHWGGQGTRPVFSPRVRNAVNDSLQVVADWQARYRERVWIGEYGASAYLGDDAAKYVAHANSIFKRQGWGASYIGDSFPSDAPSFIWDMTPPVAKELQRFWATR